MIPSAGNVHPVYVLQKEFSPHSVRSSLQMTATDMNWDPKSAPKLDFNEDYYSILEIDPEITTKDMKKAYYKIVFKYHPDNKEGKEQKDLCNKQMMVINAAYKVLKDGDARAVYDRKRKMGFYGESAKVGKSTAGSNNRQAPPKSSSSYSSSGSTTSSSSSSSASSSNPFGSYGYQNKEESYEATESLGDIFGDLWSEIRKGKSENLVGDLLDFLEDQVFYGTDSSFLFIDIKLHLFLTSFYYCSVTSFFFYCIVFSLFFPFIPTLRFLRLLLQLQQLTTYIHRSEADLDRVPAPVLGLGLGLGLERLVQGPRLEWTPRFR